MLFIASLAGLAVFIVAITHASLIARQSLKNASKQKIDRDPDQKGSIQEKPEGLSADFSALIDAITKQGDAARDEEKREDDLKQTREWLTIALLVSTVGLLGWQVYEMIEVYGPIKDQAVASGKSAETSDKSLIEAQRAWVGPLKASIDGEPTLDKLVEVTITYYNTGREPAVGFINSVDAFPAPTPDGAFAAMTIQEHLAACRDMKEWDGGSVVYPTIGGFGGGYTFSAKSKENFVGPAMTRGDEVIIIYGCFHYRTFELPRHSFFCYFFKHGQTKIENLNICPTGHEAN